MTIVLFDIIFADDNGDTNITSDTLLEAFSEGQLMLEIQGATWKHDVKLPSVMESAPNTFVVPGMFKILTLFYSKLYSRIPTLL